MRNEEPKTIRNEEFGIRNFPSPPLYGSGSVGGTQNSKLKTGYVWVDRVTALDTILVFTADGCPHCRALCEDFDRRGVDYREINLSREPLEMARLQDLVWEHRLPVVADHERVSIGFRGQSSSFAELGLE
jgi:glutaredoxin